MTQYRDANQVIMFKKALNTYKLYNSLDNSQTN